MFHVPELYRIVYGKLASTSTLGNKGAFHFPPAENRKRHLLVIASDGYGWEHVSIHAEKGNEILTPYWDEMCEMKSYFWDDEDVVMQLHPRKSDYINMHPHTLHLWRPVGIELPTPPTILVGIKSGKPHE